MEKFREHGVVPDVIDDPPGELATVRPSAVICSRDPVDFWPYRWSTTVVSAWSLELCLLPRRYSVSLLHHYTVAYIYCRCKMLQ